jgi:hypothetical protein
MAFREYETVLVPQNKWVIYDNKTNSTQTLVDPIQTKYISKDFLSNKKKGTTNFNLF